MHIVQPQIGEQAALVEMCRGNAAERIAQKAGIAGRDAAALDELHNGKDFVAVHVEAPDECTHNGDLPGKLQAIEWLDSRVVGPITQTLADEGTDFRLLILSDHRTFMKNGAHGETPVPYMI